MGNLLPLEYCTLERASRLLDCEVQDLLHWGSIGAIKLCLNGAGSGFLLDIDKSDQAKNTEEIANFVRAVYEDTYDLTRISLYSSLDVSTSSDYFYDDLVKMIAQEVCEVPVYFEGFWAIDPYYILDNSGVIAELGSFGVIDDEIKIFSPLPDESGWTYRGIIHIPNSDRSREPELNEIYIIRPDLERLYKAINGDGSLSHKYNDFDLARQSRKQEKLERQANNKTRETAPQAKMIKALIQALVGNNELLDQPFKLIDVLSATLSGKGIECPIKTGDTLKRLLEKAGND